MPTHVLDHPAFGVNPATKVPAGIAVDIDEGFQLNAEAASIAEDRAMGARDASRAGVEIEAGTKARVLIGPAGLDDAVAATDRPRTPADAIARLEHRHVVAGALKLVGRNQTGDASVQG